MSHLCLFPPHRRGRPWSAQEYSTKLKFRWADRGFPRSAAQDLNSLGRARSAPTLHYQKFFWRYLC